jgi:hypothetical protein
MNGRPGGSRWSGYTQLKEFDKFSNGVTREEDRREMREDGDFAVVVVSYCLEQLLAGSAATSTDARKVRTNNLRDLSITTNLRAVAEQLIRRQRGVQY